MSEKPKFLYIMTATYTNGNQSNYWQDTYW